MAAPVVVGVDGSPAGNQALAWAVDEAVRQGRQLRILHAYGWAAPVLPVGPDLYRAHRPHTTPEAAARDVAERAAADARSLAPHLDVTAGISPDLPAAALVAASRDASLVVVGSRGLGGFAGLLAGSVSVQVATHASIPVVVTRTPPRPSGPVVVGVDGSSTSDAVIGYAFGQAARHATGLTAVHAWTPPVDWTSGASAVAYDPALLAASAQHGLAAALAGWIAKYPDVPVQRMVVEGMADQVLIERSQTARLVVVGSRGHGGFLGLLLGSTALRLLHHAHTAVAVVRA